MFKKEEEEESKSWLLRLKDQEPKDLRPILCEGLEAKKEGCPNEFTPIWLSGADEDRMTADIDPNDIIMSNQLEDEFLEAGGHECNTEDEEIEVEMLVTRPATKPRMFMDFISIPPGRKNPTDVAEKIIEEMNEMPGCATRAHDSYHLLDPQRRRDNRHRAHVNGLQRAHVLKYALSKTGGNRLLKKDMALLVASLEKTNTYPPSLAHHFAKLPPFQPPPPPPSPPRTFSQFLGSNPLPWWWEEPPVEEDRSLPTKRRPHGTATVKKPAWGFIDYPCERCRQTGRECLPAAGSTGCTECKRSKKGCKPVKAAKFLKAETHTAELSVVRVNKRKDRAAAPVAPDPRPCKRPSYTSSTNDPDSKIDGTLPEPGPSRVTRATVKQDPVQPLPITPSIDVDYLLLAHSRHLEEAKRRRDIAENDVARAQEELEDVVHRLSLAKKRPQKGK